MNSIEINCKDIFKTAFEKRYTWDKGFKGYKGNCNFLNKGNLFKGDFVLGKNFQPKIKQIEDEKITKIIASQLFEVSIHRIKRKFEDIHSENKFNLIERSDKGIKMIVSGKNDGDKYRVKDNCINMVYRKIHGIIVEIFVDEFFDTGKGFLSTKYTSQQYDPITLLPKSQKFEYEDRFVKIHPANIWILQSRSIKYLNEMEEEEIQKFIFEDLVLLN